MADSLFALADLLKINDTSLAPIDVTDLRNEAPLMSALRYVPATHGTLHNYTKETGAPTVGFRAINAGIFLSKSTDTEVSVTLKVLEFSSQIDKAQADAYVRGGPTALVAREASRHLRAAMFAYEQQLLNGVIEGDSAGFQGLADVLTHSVSTVVDATGTTANTGSSVYALRIGESDVVGVLGNNGVFTLGETTTIKALDGSGKQYPAYYTPGSGHVGLQIGSAYSAGRICNLTADNGKGLTDALIAQLLSTFPASRQPNLLVMNRRSIYQLQKSRTATNSTGAPAPFPTESFGIPILQTDAISNTEALISGT